jgi:CBS domain-containing protein
MTALPGDSVRRAADIMRELNVGAVPVVEDAKSNLLRGIITDRDITVRCTAEGHAPTCAVKNHMTWLPLETTLPDEDVHEVMAKMERAQVRRIPVVTTEGVLIGIIAQADLATKVGPKEPREIEEFLERLSAASVPAHA